ncbi:MAG TPA: HAMP domain-containing sensor histidine kinase [Acidimicrobiales bacterium]|jgi:signal transduction histidine kinase
MTLHDYAEQPPGVSGGEQHDGRLLATSPLPQLRAAGVALALVAAVLLPGSRLAAGTADIDLLSLAGACLAATLLFATAWINVVVWRLTGDARSVYLAAAALSLAAVPVLLGVVAPGLSESAVLDRARPALALAGIPAVVLLAVAARASDRLGVRSVRYLIGLVMVVTAGSAVTLVALGLPTGSVEHEVTLPLAGPTTSLALAAVFGLTALVHADATRRRSGQALSWTALAAAGAGVAYAIEAFGGELAHPAAWAMASAALAAGLYGASVELQRKRIAEQREARDAVAVASVTASHAREVHDIHQEHRHEARAALLGIEAAAQCLDRHRDRLTAAEQRELCSGMVAEIRRLRCLVEDAARRSTSFDLRGAIMPVVACARAEGLTVRVDIPAGLDVDGIPESTAQVVLCLLSNAHCHAPDSAVDMRAEPGEREIALYVEDRGPGIPDAFREPVFERAARGAHSDGTGLGLFVARRLMLGQRGSLDFRSREGGGSTFVVRLPRTAVLAAAAGTAS